MFNLLKSLFAAPEATPQAVEASEAMAALLVEVARSDEDYADTERATIDRLLAERYGLSADEAARLRGRGEAAQEAAVDLHRFADALNRTLEYEARIAAMELFWAVALADGRRDDAENARLRLIAGLLHVPDQDSALARHRAAGG